MADRAVRSPSSFAHPTDWPARQMSRRFLALELTTLARLGRVSGPGLRQNFNNSFASEFIIGAYHGSTGITSCLQAETCCGFDVFQIRQTRLNDELQAYVTPTVPIA